MATIPEKPRRRRGRPTREEEMRHALAELGIDPALVDPLRVLASIAANRSMPPTARVAACKALLAARDQDSAHASAVVGDAISVRAQELLAAGELTMDEDDQIPVVEIYRGVGTEDHQPLERIQFVKSEIDRVHRMSGTDELADYAGDPRHPPEARMLAGARAEALWELAGEERRHRTISLELLRAATAGLGCRRWRDPDCYASLLDPAGGVLREVPLDDDAE
jgi:hypothetical protein